LASMKKKPFAHLRICASTLERPSQNPSRISPPLHPTSARTAVLIQIAARGIDDAQIGTAPEAIHFPGAVRYQQGDSITSSTSSLTVRLSTTANL
jgi:hypothetical protein